MNDFPIVLHKVINNPLPNVTLKQLNLCTLVSAVTPSPLALCRRTV